MVSQRCRPQESGIDAIPCGDIVEQVNGPLLYSRKEDSQ